MRAFLPDVNIWVALSDPAHAAHKLATEWLLDCSGARLLLCPVTEAGFVRIAASPLIGKKSIADAVRMLQGFQPCPTLRMRAGFPLVGWS